MEDCSAIHSLHPQQGVQHHSQHSTDNTLFAGVYDGHGGRSTAAYAAAQLPTVLHKELRRRGSSSSSSVDKHQVFSSAFHELDSSWAAHGHVEQSGSTAVTAMINKNNLVVANAGECLALQHIFQFRPIGVCVAAKLAAIVAISIVTVCIGRLQACRSSPGLL